MATYTVHEPSTAPADRLDRAEELVFVKDGFSWTAAFLTPFWMLANRLWLPLLGYIALLGAIELMVWALGLDARMTVYAALALSLICGFESGSIRHWTLERQGYGMVGSVNGRNAAECERRFFEAWLPDQPYVRASAFKGSDLATGAPGGLTQAGGASRRRVGRLFSAFTGPERRS